MDLMQNHFLRFLYIVPGLILGFTIHEFCHAITAYKLGDDMPKAQGRLSLSPFVHIDLWGFLMVLLVGFGWAKPVQINPRNFKKPKRDDILVSVAGPLSNLLLGFLLLVVCHFVTANSGNEPSDFLKTIYIITYMAATMNIFLFVFNLMPIPPLDGWHIFKNFLPLRYYKQINLVEKYSRYILILFLVSGLSYIIEPIGSVIINLFENLLRLF